MSVAANIAYFVLLAFLLLLIFRLIMEYVFMFARGFRPTGALAMALELAYSATDPPLNALKRVLPPLRIGNVSLDLGFILLFVVVSILLNIAKANT